MSERNSIESNFLKKINGIITENISNERFGVSELAELAGMSRSNLLRKIQKETGISASRFIREVRLKYGMELLRSGNMNVSEVSFETGFSSTSYFIKCFREYYGFPPGEAVKNSSTPEKPETGVNTDSPKKSVKRKILPISGITIIIVVASLFLLIKPFPGKDSGLEKSIAVLPFINDSNDSTNLYIINGLMESTLNNLQKIQDLRVISRTSVEKYRNVSRTIPEIAKELNVSYFVEGSGQKIGNKLRLNIQLIEAGTDTHLWSEEYIRDSEDIFSLQMEIATSIANEIKAIITPEESERINKIPTTNPEAYDLFLKGLNLFHMQNADSLLRAIEFFSQAIELDKNFARAYADLALSYYFLEFAKAEKEYTRIIGSYSDKALLLDPQLKQGLIAKAMYFMNLGEYSQVAPYLEKAHVLNPNSADVINILSDFYTNYIPDTKKYLEYALKGIRLDIASYDSATASFIFLHLANALVQSGFISEAEHYINRSLEYNPQNLYSLYVRAYIRYSSHMDLEQLKRDVLKSLEMDTTRLDILMEAGKICYFQREYNSAYYYFRKFIQIKDSLAWNVFPGEDAKIGVVLEKVGLNTLSEDYFNQYYDYARNDQSIYQHLSLAVYYSYQGKTQEALKHLSLFAQQDHFHLWTIIFLEIDPLIDNIKDLPECKKILNDLERKFGDYHKDLRAELKRKKLID